MFLGRAKPFPKAMKFAFGRFLHARSTAVKLMVFRGGLVTPFHLGQPNRPLPAKKGSGCSIREIANKASGDKEKGKEGRNSKRPSER